MKLSFKSKLIARTTPGFSVRSDRPMAESSSVLIIPPCTKPEWLAMSSVEVISTVAVPSPVSTRFMPSHAQAREGACVGSLTALSLGDSEAGRRRTRHQPALLIQHVGLAEHQRLLHLDDPTHGADAPRDDRPDEVDLELDRGVPQTILLKGRQRHTHRRVRDLRDDAALHDAAPVSVLRAGVELEHNPPWLGVADSRSKGLHPPRRRGRQQLGRPSDVFQGPRRDFLQLRTIVFCLGAAAIAIATAPSSSVSLPGSSPERRLRKRMIRSRTRAASSNCSSVDRRRISFSMCRMIASRSSRGTPAPAMISTASAWMSFELISIW